jgi:DNA-directed RNA polymerase specialized sigma24 family protein
VFLVLRSASDVIRCLITYTDWWQPATSSLYQVGPAGRDRNLSEGFRPGLLDHLNERSELCQRMELIEERDRHLLVLWYLEQLPVEDISRKLRISRRQCFRRRSNAIRMIIEAGEADTAA